MNKNIKKIKPRSKKEEKTPEYTEKKGLSMRAKKQQEGIQNDDDVDDDINDEEKSMRILCRKKIMYI